MDRLSTSAIIDAGLTDWRKLSQRFHARFRAPDASVGAAFVADAVAAAAAAGLGDHLEATVHPTAVDLQVATDLGPGGIWVRADDVTLARLLSEVATRHDVTSTPGEVQQVELGLDTAHDARLGPFWAAVLTGDARAVVGDTVFDPTGQGPSMWFQGTEPHEVPRQRWHPDLWVAAEVAEARIAAAVAAGGTLVDASEAPSFTVLADPDGNKVCVCTFLDRG
ncbi:MAG: VOC family protein [Ornithinibacter sp.]